MASSRPPLQPGMRAVTITVDTGTGAGDLLGPGDRVDLILTQTLTDQSLPAAHRVAAETVLSDVRVLAIDQKLVLGAAAPAMDRSNRTVTLEVTESQAQRISVASLLGHLSVSVRSADGIQQVAEAKQPNGDGPEPAPPATSGSRHGLGRRCVPRTRGHRERTTAGQRRQHARLPGLG